MNSDAKADFPYRGEGVVADRRCVPYKNSGIGLGLGLGTCPRWPRSTGCLIGISPVSRRPGTAALQQVLSVLCAWDLSPDYWGQTFCEVSSPFPVELSVIRDRLGAWDLSPVASLGGTSDRDLSCFPAAGDGRPPAGSIRSVRLGPVPNGRRIGSLLAADLAPGRGADRRSVP
jgi:hypothetical protein